MAAKKPSKATTLAEQYGFARSFFASDPELETLLERAIKGDSKDGGSWDTAKFEAEFRDSKWFKTHSATYRQNLAQKTSDPATYKSRLAQTIASLGDQADKMGAVLSASQLSTLADHALLSGYSDNQIQNTLSSYVKMQGSQYFGDANTNAQTLQQSAWRNGVKISPTSLQSWVQQIAGGDKTADDFQTYVRNQAASLAPGMADQLKSGQDLYDLASPYIQSMSSTLEIPTTSIDLFDPTIRNALNTKDQDGKATSQTLGQFEQSLRQDPRWMTTGNARDTFTQNAHQILQSFGFVS